MSAVASSASRRSGAAGRRVRPGWPGAMARRRPHSRVKRAAAAALAEYRGRRRRASRWGLGSGGSRPGPSGRVPAASIAPDRRAHRRRQDDGARRGSRVSSPMATTRSHRPATTRATSSIHVPARDRGQLLAPTQVIFSPETKLQYRIERLLGEGGFGQVYLARRARTVATVPEQSCIKVSTRIDGWLREAYFGQLLDGHPRAIASLRCFPVDARATAQCSTASRSSTRCTAISARSCSGSGSRGRETGARREIAGILAGARQAASRTTPAPRSHAAQRVRLR